LQVLAKRVGDISIQENPLIQVNGMERPVNSTEFEWLDFGHIHLNRGMEHLTMESHPDIIINEYYLDSNYKVTNSSKPYISFKKINPAEYVIQIESTEPFFLIFSESYHPSWKATVEGLSLDHYVVDSFANAYCIKTKGHCEILLSFTEQRIYEKGIILTLATIVVIFLCFTFFGIIKCLPLIRNIRRKMIWLNK